ELLQAPQGATDVDPEIEIRQFVAANDDVRMYGAVEQPVALPTMNGSRRRVWDAGSRSTGDLECGVGRGDAVDDERGADRAEPVELDLELVDAVEVKAVGGHLDRADLAVLDRRVDAAERALEAALAAVVERAGDLEVDHA